MPGASVAGNDSVQLVGLDHYVRARSIAPSMNGQTAQLYVRERVEGRALLHGSSGVVLFVHGAGTPAEVAFDVPYSDYSWMAYLAHGGFDVFSMDTTGYGRSTRPTVMNDPCNLTRAQQRALIPGLLAAACAPNFATAATTIASDWNDIGAVVDYVRALRHVDRVSLVAWSLGGPRAGGYAAQHPERVQRMVLLAPGYLRTAADGPPAQLPERAAMNTQSGAEFTANWDRQVGCPDQYERGASAAIWAKMLESDPVGATPTLMVAGVHDKQVAPTRVRELYADLGAQEKVFVDLACSSHNAMWETNHTILFRASLEWLTEGSVGGTKTGMLRLGYDKEQKNAE
jgi:pimeloyl-ACP methyl ester carboxylesterase